MLALMYFFTVAEVSFVTYIVAGFVQNAWISLAVGVVLLVAALAILGKQNKEEE